MRVMLVPLALLLAIAAAAPAAAQNDNNAGTVKVHDDESENPEQRNVPHVSCDFWIEGFNMNDASGTLVFYAWPPTGDKSEVTPTGAGLDWTGDEENEQGNHHFLAGPFQLPPGHYRVEVYTDDGHPGGDDLKFAKTKTFWVEPCDTPFENPPCPPGLTAVAPGDGGVELSWSVVADATGYNVYRAVGSGDFEFLANVNATSYTDADTEGGVTYSYYVAAVVGEVESVDCEAVTITTVPFFGGLALTALAGLGAVAAYVVMRRRG